VKSMPNRSNASFPTSESIVSHISTIMHAYLWTIHYTPRPMNDSSLVRVFKYDTNTAALLCDQPNYFTRKNRTSGRG